MSEIEIDHGVQRKTFDAELKALGGRAIRFVISTGEPDRDRDTIKPSGWKLTNYRKNPVVLWAHDARALPVARCTDVRVEDDKLVAVAEFPTSEVFEFGATVYELLKGGFLRATSVGFRPLKHARNGETGGTDFIEQELLEFSIVSVPANPSTLALRGAEDVTFQKWLRGDGPSAADDRVVVLELADDEIVLDLIDVPPANPLARHHQFRGGELTGITRQDARLALAAGLQDVIRNGLADVVARETHSAVCRALGRVD